ncbi:beta-lactamase/transpeptidase-like protein [Xylariaceae sp. FL1272]|nr:beta-lactamase/transpeptidase-like protein [Xylariaceae sp. FL1272]
MYLHLTGVALIASARAALSTECSIAGPGYPSPSKFSSSFLLTDAIAQFEDNLSNVTLGLQPNSTAWAVALFSSKENKTLYERFYTPPLNVSVPRVDANSVFRIGSVSKVFSVWSFLLEVGDKYFNDPITKYVQELSNLTRSSYGGREIYNDLDQVRWEDVTLGELASHAAGIPRDATANDLAGLYTTDELLGLGFPSLNENDLPTCDEPPASGPCTRKELFSYLIRQHPIFPTSHSPAYSNLAFTLLEYAQEAITGTSLSDAMTKNIFHALGMENSSYSTPPTTGGVIPGGDATEAGWDADLGTGAPSGSLYSSTSDMVKAGQAILQSTTMSQAETRRWLKPLIQTGLATTAVGAPWEIRCPLFQVQGPAGKLEKTTNAEFWRLPDLTLPNNRMTQLPTKQGDVGSYHAALALSPEHDLGWIVLTADTTQTLQSSVRSDLLDAFSSVFLPSAESQAAAEAKDNFVGTYTDPATNSSLSLVENTNHGPGLFVESLISNGKQIIGPESPFISIYGAGQSALLFPSGLKAVSKAADGEGTYDSKLGFKTTYFDQGTKNEVDDPCLLTWTALGQPLYGGVALDDWVFEMGEDGKAKAVEVRILRVRLERVE